MNNFILVHDATCNASPIILDKDRIILVQKSTFLTGTSEIILDITSDDCREDFVITTETPEQIYEKLK